MEIYWKVRKFGDLKLLLICGLNWKLDPKLAIEFFVRGNNHHTDKFNKYRISFGTQKKN